jgi:hypothetical protein
MEKRGIACFPAEDGFRCVEIRYCMECEEPIPPLTLGQCVRCVGEELWPVCCC